MNDFGFDPTLRTATPHDGAPSVCIVMPYFETGGLGHFAAECAVQSLAAYRDSVDSRLNVGLVVVDDGSQTRPFVWRDVPLTEVVKLEENVGRSAARNVGLRAATGFDITIFVDSDVAIRSDLVTSLCQLAASCQEAGHSFVIPGFFTTVTTSMPRTSSLLEIASTKNDWRWDCIYDPSWFGDPGDYLYVGTRYQLLRDSNWLRSWTGVVGPWCLANMVLGGCFAVSTAQALRLGGFDERFSSYGFTETTLVTKLICDSAMVVPLLQSAALHFETNPAHFSQPERNRRFREAHRRFFRDYLDEPM